MKRNGRGTAINNCIIRIKPGSQYCNFLYIVLKVTRQELILMQILFKKTNYYSRLIYVQSIVSFII